MAKVGLYLRGAKGKLGGATLYKGADGSTQIREIVTPYNPRTNEQTYQRAVWATVIRAYSAGKEIFDHSFEGYRPGSESQRRFTQLNCKKLRRALITDVRSDDQSVNQLARFVPRGEKYPVPWSYQISEGSLPQIMDDYGRLPLRANNETVSNYCKRFGIIPGDIYTEVFINASAPIGDNVVFEVHDADSDLSKFTKSVFGFVRITVRKDVLSNNDTLQYYKQIFDLTKTLNVDETKLYWDTMGVINPYGLVHADCLPYHPTMPGQPLYCFMGLIRSRTNSPLRSTSFMVDNDYQPAIAPGEQSLSSLDFGQSSSFVLEAWKQGAIKVGNSDLTLEGG